jgi:hypothetical protein
VPAIPRSDTVREISELLFGWGFSFSRHLGNIAAAFSLPWTRASSQARLPLTI